MQPLKEMVGLVAAAAGKQVAATLAAAKPVGVEELPQAPMEESVEEMAAAEERCRPTEGS